MNNVKLYFVGGFVRDEIIGVNSNDVDLAVEASSYQEMKEYILAMGGQIFLETPEFFTIRARIAKTSADYVLCRKEIGKYSDGRHPDKVAMGTILDDLARRDFTMNAIAKSTNGDYIDPFNGIEDINKKVIRCVGDTYDRINEDYLRLLRAARFSITKGFRIDDEIIEMFDEWDILNPFKESISRDRVREELYKMFHYDTKESLKFFGRYWQFAEICFGDDIWMKPTFEIK